MYPRLGYARVWAKMTGEYYSALAAEGDAVLAGAVADLVPRVERPLRGVPLPLVSGLEITFPLVFNEGGAKSDV